MDAIRKTLHDRLEELVARDAAMQKHLRHEDGRNDEDWTDRAALTENDEVLDALEDDALAEMAKIRQALARMDAGEYGVCSECEEPIAPGRLAALQFATRCIECARAAEQ